MINRAIALGLALIMWAAIAPSAIALTCRTYSAQICIVKIKRSAKHYWEYRASVSVAGVIQPVELYDCRRRVKVRANGTIVPFERDEAGDFVCSLFKNR